mmetsp:Transcript_29217/g.72262  ORF Transcript_29217/g.72262 Transcript_29217/m.72262 type:complete len:624 (-) Transcript_29217:202-2073(-)
MASTSTVAEFIEAFNVDYARTHKEYEDNFWATKMNLAGNSTDALTASFNALEAFLGDQTTLATVRGHLAAAGGATPDQLKVLLHIEKTFKCYIVESAEGKKVREEAVSMENKMNSARNKLGFSYTEADGAVVAATPTVLRTKIRSSKDESVRKSCWEQTRLVGPFLLDNGFPKIIAERNRFARTMGFIDFYDMKVTNAEGFSKAKCFEMLDGLEAATAPLMHKALAKLEAEKGADALKPWNMSYALSGELSRLQDPYFPFENAPEVWGRSFAAMGIKYRGTKMQLDLCDRTGKYPNGFCHWPIAPHVGQDGTWHASQANFTSLATPDEVGSGNTALTTLMHEGGHAAHFANIEQGSPLFSQERAPFSVSLAETQSMFLDSLCGDAAWLGRYARDRKGAPIPWELLERSITEKHPYGVLGLRGMIAVPYFEKALYELPEDQLTGENIARIADEIEVKIQGGLGSRPLLSVPHITSDESSCYYHGYVFAEMAVHQTRAHFHAKYGDIVDNPAIGPELLQNYWLQGSGDPGFLKMVDDLTGKPLSHDAWVAELAKETEDMVRDEKVEYAKAVATAMAAGEIDLGMHAVFVHGDEVIADSALENGYVAACAKFKTWVNTNWPKTVAA